MRGNRPGATSHLKFDDPIFWILKCNFTHLSVLKDLGKYDCMCEKSSKKPAVAPEEAAVW